MVTPKCYSLSAQPLKEQGILTVLTTVPREPLNLVSFQVDIVFFLLFCVDLLFADLPPPTHPPRRPGTAVSSSNFWVTHYTNVVYPLSRYTISSSFLIPHPSFSDPTTFFRHSAKLSWFLTVFISWECNVLSRWRHECCAQLRFYFIVGLNYGWLQIRRSNNLWFKIA